MEWNGAIFAGYGNAAILFCIAVTTFLVYFIFDFLNCKAKASELPPGPIGVPFLGNLLQMVKTPHLKLSKWAHQYGKLYTISLAHRRALVISDIKMIKELLGTMESTGKFKTDSMLLLSQGPHGIVNTEGKVWDEQRTFCMRNMRQLGYAQGRSMEPLILQEVYEVCDWIRQRSNNVSQGIIDFHSVLNQSTINALWTLVAGERLKLEDSTFDRMWTYLMGSLQKTAKTGLIFLPWLKNVSKKLTGYEDLDKASKEVHAFIDEKFKEHKETPVDGNNRDLIDAYIEHMNKINQNGGDNAKCNSFFGKQGWINSVSSVVEVFLGGGEAMASSLKWAMVYLSHHLDVQKKMQNEIDEVIGRDSDPTLLDKLRMPYTEAVILETLRLSSIAPFAIPHELLDDVFFQGYTLPKGLILMPNLYHLHHDPEIWGDPEQFRPERFLTGDGHHLKEKLVPFSAGKRQCLGEPLARDALFLYLVKFFQQFNFRPVPSISKQTYFTPDIGFLLLPKCSRFLITPR